MPHNYISGKAYIAESASISGNAHITDSACITGNAYVSGNAIISGNAYITDKAHISGNAIITGNAYITGNAIISGNAHITGNNDWCMFYCFGSTYKTITAFVDSVLGIRINCGCFSGTMQEFKDNVEATHREGTQFYEEYQMVCQLIELKLSR